MVYNLQLSFGVYWSKDAVFRLSLSCRKNGCVHEESILHDFVTAFRRQEGQPWKPATVFSKDSCLQ